MHQPENDDKRFELLDGQLVEFSPAGLQHGLLAAEMCFHIYDANKRASLGLATARCGYHPPDDQWTVLGPSAAFTRKARVQYPLAKKYAALMPDLAVEIASFCNPRDWVGKKLPKYLQHGTQLVWIVIPERKGAEVCQLGADGDIEREFIGLDGRLSGESVLPGFTLEIARLFM